MAYSARNYKKNSKKRSKKLLFIILGLILVSTIVLLFFNNKTSEAPSNIDTPSDEQSDSQITESYESINLQSTIDEWIQKYPASYSISIYDLQNGSVLGSNNPDEKIFAASLYKIYVAYLSLLDFQTGAQKPDDILIAGQTKRECVDKMIRNSDSPCGEAMMAEIGQSVLNERVSNMGMNGTIFNGIQTTAADSALILRYISEGRDLNKENSEFLLDSMLTQEAKFKRGLQTGAPDAQWQTKVGWNEDMNYHDIGIMTLDDGRKFAIAILGKGSGSPEPIADFANTIYAKLNN